MKFWKEFPDIQIDYDKALEIVERVLSNKDLTHIRTLKRLENFDYEHSTLDSANDTDWKKRAEYMKKAIFAYKLTEEEIKLLGLQCKTAHIFKTDINTTPYIHREGRSMAINFPLVFEPGKSFVAFYDDNCLELERHELVERIPVYYQVSQWHTVHNQSQSTPRIVLTCSDLVEDWKKLLS